MEDKNELMHYRTKGSKNGIRRYQNEDGSLTPLGRIHYGVGDAKGARNGSGSDSSLTPKPKRKVKKSLKDDKDPNISRDPNYLSGDDPNYKKGINNHLGKKATDGNIDKTYDWTVNPEYSRYTNESKNGDNPTVSNRGRQAVDRILFGRNPNPHDRGKNGQSKDGTVWDTDDKNSVSPLDSNKGPKTVADVTQGNEVRGKYGRTKDGTNWTDPRLEGRPGDDKGRQSSTKSKFANTDDNDDKYGATKDGTNWRKPDTPETAEPKKNDTGSSNTGTKDSGNKKQDIGSNNTNNGGNNNNNRSNSNNNNQTTLTKSKKLEKGANIALQTKNTADNLNTLNKTVAKIRNRKTIEQEMSEMSNQELRARNERQALENTYRQNNAGRMSKGQQFVSDFLSIGSTVAGAAVTALTLAKLFKELRGE